MLVIAGAGSGKTRALTHRIAYLIKERSVHPSNILAVTFTNKAAAEMVDRLEKLLEGEKLSTMPVIGTFHAICVRILRKHIHEIDYENSFVIYDGTDQLVLVKRIMKALSIDEKEFNPKAILHHISDAKNQLVGPIKYEEQALDYFSTKVAQVYRQYQDELKKNNALDFDDLIMKVVELFKSHPNLLEFYQDKFLYLNVDEYQDTNYAQYILVRQLSEKYRNLMVIGDSDQSIYSWRGADMRNILDFEKDFPECKTVLLEQNYRSTQNILKAAHNVIVKNSKRKEKELWTDNDEGDSLRVFEARNEREEATYIVNEINRIMQNFESPDFNEFAVLYRTNAQSRVMEEVFLRFGIPYRIVGGIKFYARKEIKDILAYLRILVNPHDSVSLLRVINTPARKIGNTTLSAINNYAIKHNFSFWSSLKNVEFIDELNEGKKETIGRFVRLIERLSEKVHSEKASAIIRYVLEDSGYKKMLQEDGSVEAESRLENISELVSVASKYDALENGMSLNVFLEEVALISDLDGINENQQAVTLMTLHSAKGLEYPHVFMIGLEEGIFPHSRSMLDPSQLEEERRLMYVGITRAEKSLSLIYANERMLYGETQRNNPSQFLYDIPNDIIESNSTMFKAEQTMSPERLGSREIPDESLMGEMLVFKDGERVKHPTFGVGVVVNVTGGVVTVAFSDPKIGVKKLAISVAPLEKV
jgi:DNA helicase-2/ATP-dependent DNA helicase PcrA